MISFHFQNKAVINVTLVALHIHNQGHGEVNFFFKKVLFHKVVEIY